MRSFLFFFYVLDQCYDQCKEDDLGGLLGAISPELREDGLPMDMAIFNAWREKNGNKNINRQNILNLSYDFLEEYEKRFGFKFTKTKWILMHSFSNMMLDQAIEKAEMLYQKNNYIVE